MNLERFATYVKLTRESWDQISYWSARAALVLGGAYVLASMLSAWLMSGILASTLQVLNKPNFRQPVTASVNFGSGNNYRDIRKAIMDRNLFNSSGEFPEEASANPDEKHASNFDMNAPCVKTTLNISLLGTIYLEGGESIATVLESGYSDADVYREGDNILGHDQASVAKIERNRVVLNNGGTKECLELAAGEDQKRAGAPGVPGAGTGEGSPPGEAVAGNCVLDEKYVQDELGPGFGTIITKARLVPNTADNAMNGFKIFAINGNSLLGKVGLENGDVITQVNEVSLKQPEQGFALYQAFQDEREVRIHILRRGTTPMTINCRIR